MQFCNRLRYVIGSERESFKVVNNSLDWEQDHGMYPLHEETAVFVFDLLGVMGGLELPNTRLFPLGDTVFADAVR